MKKVKLGEVIQKPLSGEWGYEDVNNNGTYVLRTTNFTNDGILTYKDVIKRKIEKNNIQDKYLRKGDILIEKSGGSDKQPVGRVVFFEEEENKYLFNNFTSILRVKDDKTCFSKYLFYSLFFNYLNGGTRFYENKTTGIHNLKLEQYIKTFEISLPSVEEQKEIADRLDKVSSLIEKRKTQLEKLDQLIKSRFIEMFGLFDKVELYTVADIIMGQSPESSSYNDNGKGTPFFQGKADYGDKYTVVRHWTDKPTKRAKQGDVLMSVRAPVGPVNISSVDCCIGRGLCSINAHKSKTNNEFLYNALKTIENEIASMGTGSTFKAITKNDVYSLLIPNAPFDLQEVFSHFVEQTDKSKLAIQKSIDKLETLKKSLMQQYFG